MPSSANALTDTLGAVFDVWAAVSNEVLRIVGGALGIETTLLNGFAADWWPALALVVLGIYFRSYVDWQERTGNPFTTYWNPFFVRLYQPLRKILVRWANMAPGEAVVNLVRVLGIFVLWPFRKAIGGSVNLGGRVRSLFGRLPYSLGIAAYILLGLLAWATAIDGNVQALLTGIVALDPVTWAVVAAAGVSALGWVETIATGAFGFNVDFLGPMAPVWTFFIVLVGIVLLERGSKYVRYRLRVSGDYEGPIEWTLRLWRGWWER